MNGDCDGSSNRTDNASLPIFQTRTVTRLDTAVLGGHRITASSGRAGRQRRGQHTRRRRHPHRRTGHRGWWRPASISVDAAAASMPTYPACGDTVYSATAASTTSVSPAARHSTAETCTSGTCCSTTRSGCRQELVLCWVQEELMVRQWCGLALFTTWCRRADFSIMRGRKEITVSLLCCIEVTRSLSRGCKNVVYHWSELTYSLPHVT